jgi:hypothetical protein
MSAQALVSKPTIEGLDETILHRLSWPDEIQLELSLVSPGVEVFRSEFGSVVESDHSRLSTLEDQSVKYGRYLSQWKRLLRCYRERFPCKQIHHGQHSKPTTIASLTKSRAHR